MDSHAASASQKTFSASVKTDEKKPNAQVKQSSLFTFHQPATKEQKDSPLISHYELTADSWMADHKMIALPNSCVAVPVNKTQQYEICLMSDNTEPVPGKIYLRQQDNTLTYTVITPENEIIRDAVLYRIPPNSSYSFAKLVSLKKNILALTADQGHTHQHSVEIWHFTENQKEIIATIKTSNEVLSLSVSPEGYLYIGHATTISVWNIQQLKQIDYLATAAMIRAHAGELRRDDPRAQHTNTHMVFTPEGYLFVTGQDFFLVIEYKNKKCLNVFTTDDFYANQVELPVPYFITTKKQEKQFLSDHSVHRNLVTIIWNKNTGKPLDTFECWDWPPMGSEFKRYKAFYRKHEMLLGQRVLFLNKIVTGFLGIGIPDYTTRELQILSLKKSTFSLIFSEFYHTVEKTIPTTFLTDLLLAFPDGKHFLCTSHGPYNSSREEDRESKFRVYDMTTKKCIHTLPHKHHASALLLSDQRVLLIDGPKLHLLTYRFAQPQLEQDKTNTLTMKFPSK